MATLQKLHALATVLRPRVPTRPVYRSTANPFAQPGDIVADCGVKGCGWHAQGARPMVKKAWDEHYRMFHGTDRENGVILLNTPKQ